MRGDITTIGSFARHASFVAIALSAFSTASLLAPPAFSPAAISRAEAQQSVTIPRVELPGAVFSATISGITVSGANLPSTEIEAMFRTSSIADLANRLERLNAARITINTVELKFVTKEQVQTTTYQGFDLSDIRAGVIRRTEIAGGKQTTRPTALAVIPMNGETIIGKTNIEALDLVTMFRWFSQSDPSGNAPFKDILASYTVEPSTFTMDELAGRIGKFEGGFLKVRLLRRPMQEIFESIAKNSEGGPAKSPGVGLAIDLVDLYNSVAFGSGRVEPITLSGKEKITKQAISFEIGASTFSGAPAARGNVGAISIKSGEVNMRLGGMSWQGDHYSAMFAGLAKGLLADKDARAASSAAEIAWLENYLDTLQLGDLGLRLDGLDLDLPAAKGQPAAQRTRVSMTLFDARAAGFIGVVPTDIGLRIDRLKMPLPAASRDQTVMRLRKLGLKDAEVSANIAANWDASSQILALSEAKVGLEQVGSARIAGKFGNVPRRFFENPIALWGMLLAGSTAQQLDITVSDLGGLPKLLAMAASEQGKSPQQFQTEISSMAPAIVAAFASDHPDAPMLIDALGKFLRGLGEMKLSARSRAPEGIGLVELMAFPANPGAVLRKLRIEASGR